jgi:hypothetical protein
MGIDIWEQFMHTANQAYSRGLISNESAGMALADIGLPDAQGRIAHQELELALLRPLAQTIVFRASKAIGNASSLYVILNTKNQNLVIPQMRMELDANLRRLQLGEILPEAVRPFNEFVGALSRAGEILTAAAGQLLTRDQARIASFRN